MEHLRWTTALVVCLTAFAAVSHAAEYHVESTGSNSGPGTAGQPWATLQHAADTVGEGDTVIVHAGTYDGFHLTTSGTADSLITFRAERGVLIDQPNGVTGDGINLEGASYVVVEGFTVKGASPGLMRNGLRAVLGEHVTFRGNSTSDNAERGIFTAFVDDVLIEGNEAAFSIDEHGVYVSNSGDRPVIRDNYLHGNNAAGIHMNGDVSEGGDGVISDALVERNVIVDNGKGGAAGVNCDGVQDSVIRNNLIIGGHASGITLFRIDGGKPSKRNLVVNNTVVNDDDGRWGITVRDGSTDNTLVNNIFLSRHGFRGAVDVSDDSLPGLVSDFNVVEDRFTTDGGDSTLTLAQWRARTGGDQNSLVATESDLFVDPILPDGDYRLKTASPALDLAFQPVDSDLRRSGPVYRCDVADINGLGRPQDGDGNGTFACDAGAVELQQGADIGPSQSGAYFDPERNGEGYFVEVLEDGRAWVTFFTYTPVGGAPPVVDSFPAWHFGLGRVVGNSVVVPQLFSTQGGRFGEEFDAGEISSHAFAGLSLVFPDCEADTELPGRAYLRSDQLIEDVPVHTDQFTRAVRLSAIVGCDGEPASPRSGLSGNFYDPERDGEGIVIQWLGQGNPLVIWFTFDIDGQQLWMISDGAEVEGDKVTAQMLYPETPTAFGPDFDPEEIGLEPWGTLTLQYLDCNTLEIAFDSVVAGFGSGGYTYRRLTQPAGTECEL